METEWWKTAVIYQIYPRSFQDSNGDGVGDLNGIRRRLPYLAALGVDAVWVSPFYPSPMVDFGYDVADYCDVDPLFGTLADCKSLIAEAHALDLKVILDLVPNHTSDQHPWFIESRSSRQKPKRDWYIWKDARPGGGPPNNWVSHFGGSAWEWDEASGQYYYHAYLEEQPDLNWRNPEVRSAMYDVLRFWLELGVDGFRVDVIWHLMKDSEFRDNPPNLDYRPEQPEIDRWLPIHSADQPEVHEVIEEMRAVVDEYPHRFLIGEIYLPLALREPGIGVGRDPVRTPMQWDCSPHAGFSTTRPWLPLADNWTGQNVASLDLQPFSILSLYRRLLALRRNCEALRLGRYETLTCRDDVFGFARSVGQEKLIVMLNFSHERRTVSMGSDRATVLLSTVRDRSGERAASEFMLDANEAVIIAEET